jgi:hypothetical protein
MPLLKRSYWEVNYKTFGDGFHYFFYAATLLSGLNKNDDVQLKLKD